jgi:hypothetical protein
VIDHALQSITGVIAYGVRVSAYGIARQWLRRPRKRLRPGPEHTGRSARSGGSHSAGLRAPAGYVQPAIDFAGEVSSTAPAACSPTIGAILLPQRPLSRVPVD